MLGEVTKLQGVFSRRLGKRDPFLTEAVVRDLTASFTTSAGVVIDFAVDAAKLCHPEPATKECWLFKALLAGYDDDEDVLLAALKRADFMLQVKPCSVRRASL